MSDITKRIANSLEEIEESHNVRTLYCCESGSRAWGFPSQDSDYDARFLYVHQHDWYFSIDVEDQRDVIERPITDMLDLNGWDLRKALVLLRKSNPPLFEWLQSPIIYLDRLGAAESLRTLLPDYYSAISSHFHYLHMARGNYRDYLRGDVVRVKKYFYVLRPLLAILWIEKKLGPVPTEFSKLVDLTINEPTLRQEIDNLLIRKRAGEELDQGPRIPVISDFISREIERLEALEVTPDKKRRDMDRLNTVFRDLVGRAWA